jgi:hypothetical protein
MHNTLLHDTPPLVPIAYNLQQSVQFLWYRIDPRKKQKNLNRCLDNQCLAIKRCMYCQVWPWQIPHLFQPSPQDQATKLNLVSSSVAQGWCHEIGGQISIGTSYYRMNPSTRMRVQVHNAKSTSGTMPMQQEVQSSTCDLNRSIVTTPSGVYVSELTRQEASRQVLV